MNNSAQERLFYKRELCDEVHLEPHFVCRL